MAQGGGKDSVKYSVLDSSGKETRSIELEGEIFNGSVRPDIVHSVVVWQRAKARAGTHSTLTKGEMRGGGKKPFRQKGTGGARAGSNTSPLWVGGGVSHGPKPRDYTTRVGKRTRKQALVSVLSNAVAAKSLILVDKLQIESGKTKDGSKPLESLGVAGKKVTVLTPNAQSQEALRLYSRALRNIPGVKVLPVSGANVYDLLNGSHIVSTPEAINQLVERLKPAGFERIHPDGDLDYSRLLVS